MASVRAALLHRKRIGLSLHDRSFHIVVVSLHLRLFLTIQWYILSTPHHTLAPPLDSPTMSGGRFFLISCPKVTDVFL